MSYLGYVVAAYAVFAAALLWDFMVPRLLLRRELRAARLRAARADPHVPTNAPLQRD